MQDNILSPTSAWKKPHCPTSYPADEAQYLNGSECSHLPTGFAFSQASQSAAMIYSRKEAFAAERRKNRISSDTCNNEQETVTLCADVRR